ncbi:MAG: hypothetical protein DRP79_04925 [Planctomycetota bacterium]|nr:MAG: hypothetical protein DRP79_04925 [Planctomycetota bacterium]
MNCDVTGIIRRIAEKGDTEAYGELVKKYSDAAFAVALSILGNREDARDMTQDAFVMAYEMLPDLRDPGKFGCWLKRIVSGLSKNFLRDRQRRVAAHTAAVQHAAEVVQGPLAHVAEREEDTVVYRQIQALPERHRTVIIMKYLEGMRYDDIASFLDISVRSVKALSMEAKRLLLVRLKKQGIAAPALLRVRTA